MNREDFDKKFGNHPFTLAMSILGSLTKEMARFGSVEIAMEMEGKNSFKTNPHALVIGGYLELMYKKTEIIHEKDIDERVEEILSFIGLPTRNEIMEDLDAFEKSLP